MGWLDKLKRRFGFRGAPVYIGGVSYDLDEALRHVNVMSASQMYKTQPHLRTVVSFLGRNIAHLGLHAYKRLNTTDRQRDTSSPLGAWLSGNRANPTMTMYDMVFAIVVDLALYDRAFMLPYEGADGWAVYRVPPAWVTPAKKDALGSTEHIIRSVDGAGPTVAREKTSAIWSYVSTRVTGVSPQIES